MQHFLLFVLIIFSLSSCTTYQYITLASDDVPKNEKKEFLWENDTTKISYQFSGEGGLMTIAFFNKTSQPLYVNWKKSALINEGKTVSLYNKTVIVTGAVETDIYRINRNQTIGSSFFLASFDLPEGIDFIPPMSGLNKSLINLQDLSLVMAPLPQELPQKKIKSKEGAIIKVRDIQYENNKSPLKFKIYLTLATGQSPGGEFSVQHSFYANEVLQTGEFPDLFPLYRSNGSQFYIRQQAQ